MANLKYQKNNITHKIYKCEFLRKNEKQYKQIKQKANKIKF